MRTIPVVYPVNNLPNTHIVSIGNQLWIIWPNRYMHVLHIPPVIDEDNTRWLF